MLYLPQKNCGRKKEDIIKLNKYTMKTREFESIKEGRIKAKRYFVNIRQTTRGEYYNKKRMEFAL